jgi:hypothetical protein
MKKTIILPCLFFIAVSAFAQEQNGSKGDEMISTPDQVMQREYVNISIVNHVSIVVEYITNVSNSQKVSALDLEFKTTGDNSETVTTLLDPDETDALVAFLQSIPDKISKATPPKNYTEYSFYAKSNFEAGCYWEDKKWKAYIKIDREDSKAE